MVQVDVYFTRQSEAKPVGFERTDAGELWFLEAPQSGFGSLVHLLPSVSADSTFGMNPTQTSVAPDTYSATPPSVFTVPPRKSAAASVVNTVSGDSAGAFVRYQIPTISSWTCDLEARDALFFTERQSSKVGRFDPVSSRFEEWDTPTPQSYPVGLLARGDTVFFVEADSCRLGRLVVSDSEITEWDIPNTSGGWPGYPGLDRDSVGHLWLTCSQGPHLLVEVEIGTGDTARFSEWTVPGNPAEGPMDVAVDRDGGVWYSIMSGISGYDTSKIGVLAPVRQEYREWRVPDENAGAYYLELDEEGCVWVGETDGSAVARLSPSENEITTYPIGLPHGYVYDYTLDGKGNVWVACYDDYALLKFSGVAPGVCEGREPRDSDDGLIVWPNPFSSLVHCPPLLKCSVFDQSGRLVAEVRNGVWDGRGLDGRELGAGVYVITAGAREPVAVVKLR
jgi:streptogramin lyase